MLDISSVTQIDVLEEYQLLLVLATKSLMSYPLEVLDSPDNVSPILKRPKKIQNHANFFKAGGMYGKAPGLFSKDVWNFYHYQGLRADGHNLKRQKEASHW